MFCFIFKVRIIIAVYVEIAKMQEIFFDVFVQSAESGKKRIFGKEGL